MKEYSYQEQNNMENQLKIRQLLQELPDFTRTFFRGIEPRTSSRTRLGYGYDLRIFFEFLQEYNPSVAKMDIRDIPLEILDQVKALDIEEYLEYLIDQYQNLIYSICLKSVGNPFDAEDLTQEVFLSAYKSLAHFDGLYEKAWLSKIAVRKCLDFLKAAGRRSIPTEDIYFSQLPDLENHSSPEEQYLQSD